MNRGGLISLKFRVQNSQICDLANQYLFDTSAISQIWRGFQKAEKYRVPLNRHDFIPNVICRLLLSLDNIFFELGSCHPKTKISLFCYSIVHA